MIRVLKSWQIPVRIVATVAVFSGILFEVAYTVYVATHIHLLSGGLMLSAFFMATDYATSPMSHWGQIIFGIGIGLITMVIRVFGAYPEGLSFAILILDDATPLLNIYLTPTRNAERMHHKA